MLKITVKLEEYWDQKSEVFISKDFVLELEHSLVSLSKWESIYEKPFLGAEDKTTEETLGYIKAMTLTPDVPPEVYDKLSQENVDEVQNYIEAKMTATTIYELPGTDPRRMKSVTVTSELIYYWLIAFNIPFDTENWHLNRLLTLIKVCNIKNAKPKKMSHSEATASRQALNAERRTKYNTRG